MSPAIEHRIVYVDETWPRMQEVRDLYWDVLYQDFGVSHEDDWFHAAAGGEVAVALGTDDALLGAARLMPAPGQPSRQFRQVAVVKRAQGAGLGRELILSLLDRAAEEGAEEAWLNARETAIPFYERCGFVAEGPVFISELTKIPHRLMRAKLSSVE